MYDSMKLKQDQLEKYVAQETTLCGHPSAQWCKR